MKSSFLLPFALHLWPQMIFYSQKYVNKKAGTYRPAFQIYVLLAHQFYSCAI